MSRTKTKGYAANKIGKELTLIEYDLPELGPMDVLINITHCGICHSDLHLLKDDWGITKFPTVPGHEIIGHVEQVGSAVKELKSGQRVGVGWLRDSCHHCEWCHGGEDNLCSDQKETCVAHYGGFAKKIVVDSRSAFHIPEALDSENAAPLLCGGATVFSPMLRYRVNGLSRVGIVGIGGLGHLAIQFARALGAEVYAISSSPEKEEEAKKLGAHYFIHSSNLEMFEGSMDLVISSVSGGTSTEAHLTLLRPKGVLCLVGAPQDRVETTVVDLLIGRKSIVGSNIASGEDIKRMLTFAARHNICAMTEIFPIDQVNKALTKLAQGKIRYRAVLKI